MSQAPTSAQPVRVFPVTEAPSDGPCAYVRYRQACREISPRFRAIEGDHREWRLAVAGFANLPKDPFNRIAAAIARTGQAFARHREDRLARRLLPAVNAHLGLPGDEPMPVCEAREETSANRPGPARVLTTLTAVTALIITPVRPEIVPLTPAQKMDAELALGAFCTTGGGSGGVPHQAPCCTPKTALEPRRKGQDPKNTGEIALA